jgi:hypothetical protein
MEIISAGFVGPMISEEFGKLYGSHGAGQISYLALNGMKCGPGSLQAYYDRDAEGEGVGAPGLFPPNNALKYYSNKISRA